MTDTIGTLCARGYPDKLTHQDIVSGLYPIVPPPAWMNIKEKNNMGKVYVVRRLTPTECGRLQGMPDGWTQIGDWVDSKGKKHLESKSDAAQYKAYGNGIALPYWFHLLSAISDELGEGKHTLGSLFDGIGSFPLAWTYLNGADSVLWNSEIEEFPEAVTTKHFGDEDNGIVGDVEKYIIRRAQE